MAMITRLLALCGGVLALSACATTDRYAAAYDSCDREAGACYADCRVLDDEDRKAACQQRCTASVNRCFGQVREASLRERSFGVAPGAVFYGRYGAYDPFLGYRFGRHGRPYTFRGYAYDRFGYDRWGYDRYGFDRFGYDYHGYAWGPRHPRFRGRGAVIGPGTITRNSTGAPGVGTLGTGVGDAPVTRAPRAPDDGRFETEDGGVFTADGRRLRYGGLTEPRVRPRTNGVRPTGRTKDPTVRPAVPGKPTAAPRGPRADPAAKPANPVPRAAPIRPRTAPRAAPRLRSSRPRAVPSARGGDAKRSEP